MKSQYLDSFFIPHVSRGQTSGNKIMIVLHGLGDSLESYKSLTAEINVTGLNYLLLNAPTPYFFGYSWYDIPPGNPRPGIERSVALVKKIIEEVHANGFEYQDIFLCGFSQGGCIVIETMLKMSHKLGGVLALSPRIYAEELAKPQSQEILNTPFFVGHGLYDEVIPFESTKVGVTKLEGLGFNVELKNYEMGHEISIEQLTEIRLWLSEFL